MENTLPLRDIHLPDPVSWFPPAIGWWLSLILLIALLLAIRWLIKRSRRPRLKKQAREEIESIIQRYLVQSDKHEFVVSLSIAIKRIGMSYFERDQVAGSSGPPWLHKINGLTQKGHLTDKQLELLAAAPYQKSPMMQEADINELIKAVRSWVSALPASTGERHV